MFWLQQAPILRWLGAGLLVAIAVWSELTPPPTTNATVLATDVVRGTPLEDHHTTTRRVPVGLVETVDPHGVAASDLKAGDPLLASMIAEVEIPEGWVIIEAPIPDRASPGSPAVGIVLAGEDPPLEFPARVVSTAAADALDRGSGALAIPPEWVAVAAKAAAGGQLVVGVSSQDR